MCGGREATLEQQRCRRRAHTIMLQRQSLAGMCSEGGHSSPPAHLFLCDNIRWTLRASRAQVTRSYLSRGLAWLWNVYEQGARET